MTKRQHQKHLNALRDDFDTLSKEKIQEMIAYALEHNLELYLYPYGTLMLKDDHYIDKVRGNWMTSSDKC